MSTPFDSYLGHLPLEYREALSKEIKRTSKVVHLPVVTPHDATPQPGLGPSTTSIGNIIGLIYTSPANDRAYTIFRLDEDFIGTPSFHIHWTKGTDANEQGDTVRWKLDYTVFNPEGGSLLNGSSGTILFDEVYTDSGTTTRAAYSTEYGYVNGDFLPGNYVGIAISVVAAGTTVASPVLITADLVYDVLIE